MTARRTIFVVSMLIALCVATFSVSGPFQSVEILTPTKPLEVELRGGVLVRQPPQPPPPPPCSYQGDALRYRERSSVYASLGPFSKGALLTLANTEYFCDKHVGISERPNEVAQAMQVLAIDAHADAAFKELVLEGELPAQMYGLCGVFFTDPQWFAEAAVRLKVKEEKVHVWFDCSTSIEDVHDVIRSPYTLGDDVESGHLPLEFLRDVYGERQL